MAFGLGAFAIAMPDDYWKIAPNGLSATFNRTLDTGQKITATYKSDADSGKRGRKRKNGDY